MEGWQWQWDARGTVLAPRGSQGLMATHATCPVTAVPRTKGEGQWELRPAGGRMVSVLLTLLQNICSGEQAALLFSCHGLWLQKLNSLLSCCEKQLWHCRGWGKATGGCSVMGDGGVTGGEKRAMLLPGKAMKVVSDGKHFIQQAHCLLFRPSLSKSSQGMPVIVLFFSAL